MNNFLNQFDSSNYKKSEQNVEIITEKLEDVEVKPKKHGIVGPEHETEIDTDYNKKKRRKYLLAGGILLLVCVFVTILIISFNRVTVMDFVGKDVNEVKVWALKNNILLDTKYVFNNEYLEGIVISQSKEETEVIYKKGIFYIEVSKGTDFDEKITIPDFKSMDYSKIRDWVEENKLSNTYIIQEYSSTVEKNAFIKSVFSDEGIDENNFRRKDSLSIYVSKGVKPSEKNIDVIDFYNKLKGEVDTWATTNEVKIKYVDVASDVVADGSVVSQNIAAGESVAKGDLITIGISIGKASIVPDFSNIIKEDAQAYAGDITVTVKTIYSDTVQYGKLISQSVPKGTKLYKGNKQIQLFYSEGKPFIDDLIGKSEREMPLYFYELNVKGAEITYTTVYVDSAETKGNIVWCSKKNEYLSLKTSIIIHVSKGNS